MMPENDRQSQKVSVSLIALTVNFHFFADFSPFEQSLSTKGA
jgi:hypothetical protein